LDDRDDRTWQHDTKAQKLVPDQVYVGGCRGLCMSGSEQAKLRSKGKHVGVFSF